jgi:signal-transduction protein with cAMP-binding, CBS, and nucleotidyltransferase domain
MANIELFSMNEGRNRYLAKIEAAVKNIFSIYDDLSYLVKKDQIDYPSKAINLGEYVEKRLEFFDEVAHFSNLSFEYTPIEFPAWIWFNETKLQRVILSLEYKITLTNTTERIKELNNLGLFDKQFASELIEAYDTLLSIRLRFILSQKQGSNEQNYVNPKLLTKPERDLLKDAFKIVNTFKKFLTYHFHLGMVV